MAEQEDGASLAPMLRADSIKVCGFSTSVLPRKAARTPESKRPRTAMMTFAMPLPMIATTAIASRMRETPNSTSQMRMMMRSHQPS